MTKPGKVFVKLLLLGTLAAFGALAWCPSHAAPSKAKAEDAEFTVASYNINYGNPNLKAVVKTIARADATVVALQETNRKSERYLRKHLKRSYPFMTFIGPKGSPASGFAYLSKVPLKQVKFLPKKYGKSGAYFVTVKLGGKKVQLVNVHLLPTLPKPGDTMLSYVRRWQAAEKIRRKEVKYIMARVSDKLPHLILGDFNSLPDMATAMLMKTLGLTDSYGSVTPRRHWKSTWHWQDGKIDWRARIDYIFHHKSIKTLASGILKTNGSDHYLIHSKFDWHVDELAAKAKPEN